MDRFTVFKPPLKGWVVEARSIEAKLVIVNFGHGELAEDRAHACAADLNSTINDHVRGHARDVFAAARAERL